MSTLVTDPEIQSRLRQERQATGADRFDEVWEGVYVIAPLPNNEHQHLATRLATILDLILGLPGLGAVRAGINLADQAVDWRHDYRVPDVAVFLSSGRAENRGAYWFGPADFLIEITSPGDQTSEKLPFYSRLGVRELLIIQRELWALELYRFQSTGLERVAVATEGGSTVLVCQQVPLRFGLVPGDSRPRIEVRHLESEQRWLV